MSAKKQFFYAIVMLLISIMAYQLFRFLRSGFGILDAIKEALAKSWLSLYNMALVFGSPQHWGNYLTGKYSGVEQKSNGDANGFSYNINGE